MDGGPRKHLDHLTGEHRQGDAGQLLFALLFAAAWAGDTFFLRLTTVFPGYLPWFIRIPIGFAVCILGYVLAAAGVLLAAAVFLHLISRYEEKLLLQRFGAEYAAYMKNVPMWIPQPRK